jgi:hypothetical protein
LSRGDLNEAEWRLLKDLLPAERGRKSRPAFDNRVIVNGILIVIASGLSGARARVRLSTLRMACSLPNGMSAGGFAPATVSALCET